jgi:tetratricopeptide (TPR) repeat protein
MRYAAFISYNHKDRRAAGKLHRALETYRLPARIRGRETAIGTVQDRLPPIFQDREELASSSDLAASVRAALEQTHTLIVLCSPHAARSRWVNEEIRAFMAMGRRDRIQGLIIDGEPNASRTPGADPAQECLPPALFEDGGGEPLASDVRAGQDGWQAARLKLIAGILGVPYDELRQRDLARRQRRLMAIAAASAVGFVVMAALTVFALVSRTEAIAQRDLARQKTATAERTVAFVESLFEVSDPSEARGAKITAQEVLDKGAERIRTTLDEEPNVKAQLMTTLSKVYLGLGSYKRGEALIRQSMSLPVSDAAVRAQQLMGLASSAERQGDYKQAVRLYRMALPFADADAVSGDETRAAILAALGDAASGAGDSSVGDEGMRAALRFDTARFGADSLQVARDLEALGHFEEGRERFADARRLYERAVAIRLKRQGLSHPLVSEGLNQLGSIAYFQKDAASAERFMRKALESDMLVLGRDHPDVAITLNNLARLMLERQEYAGAKPLLEHAVAITLKNRSATNDYLALLYANLGIAHRGVGDVANATAHLEKALRIGQLTEHRNVGPILTELADLACRRGAAREGLALLDRAEPITRRDYSDDPWRAAWVANTRGACLTAAGRRAAAVSALSASLGPLRERWPAGSMYRVIAERRLAVAQKSGRAAV